MPKNMGKGGKNRKRGTNKNEPQKRELTLKEAGQQEYAQITKMLGNSRLECSCADGIKRIGVICGAMRRRVFMTVGDIVLVSLRDFEKGKVDIIGKYNQEEAKELLKRGELAHGTMLNEAGPDEYHGVVEFADDADEEGEESEDDLQLVNVNRNRPVAAPVDEDEEDGHHHDKVDVDNI